MGTRTRSTRLAAALVICTTLAMAACSNSSSDDDAAPDDTENVVSSSAPTNESTPADTVTSETTPSSEPSVPLDTTGTTDGDQVDLGEFAPISGVSGVTDDEIQFAVIGTGPSNPAGYCLLECYSGGVKAYFDYRNSLGGVNGRQLTLSHEVDDELANTQVGMLDLLGSDDVFGIFFASLIPSGFADAEADGTPVYGLVQAGPDAAGHDNVFLPAIFCADCIRASTVHQAQLAGATKVATLGLGVSQASIDCVSAAEKAFDTWGPELGIEHVYANATLPFGLPNGVAPEVTAMKDLGVDYITLCMDQGGALTIEQELHRQGMADVPLLLPQGYPDQEFLDTNADLLDGDLLSVFFRPFEADQTDTSIPDLVEWVNKGGYKLNDQTVQGWINADMAVAGLLAAGPEFDGPAVIEATNAITSYDADGVIPNIDWTKQHAAYTGETMLTDGPPTYCSALVRIEDGKFTLVGDPELPYYEYDNTTLDWVEPQPSDCRAS